MGILVVMSDIHEVFLTFINVLGRYSNFRVIVLLINVSDPQRTGGCLVNEGSFHVLMKEVTYLRPFLFRGILQYFYRYTLLDHGCR